MERLGPLLRRLAAYYQALPAQRRMTLVAMVALTFAATAMLWGYAVRDPRVPLFVSPLDASTTAEIAGQLGAAGVDFRIEQGSRRILVPRSQRGQLAVELDPASQYGSADELMTHFGEGSIGTTTFGEGVRYTSLLQRHIEQKLNALDAVVGSSVSLSLPTRSLYAEDQEDPSASVRVDLRGGASLSREEGRRMAKLVARAVTGLSPDRVEILDAQLGIIHASSSENGESAAGASLADLQRQQERYLKTKIEKLLSSTLGPGKVIAEVAVELDRSQRTVQQNQVDGDRSADVSVYERENTSTGAARAGGTPGTTANLPEAQQASASSGSGSESSETESVINKEPSHTRSTIASSPGGVESVMASVIVDGDWAEPAEPGGERTYTARTDEELTNYRALVASAIGTPIDKVTVRNFPFPAVDMVPESSGASSVTKLVPQLLPWGSAFVAMLLTFAFVVRPTMRQVLATPLHDPRDDAALGDGGAPVGQLDSPNPIPEKMLAEWLHRVAQGDRYVERDEVNRLVSADLVHSTVTLQSWIEDAEEPAA